MKISGALSMLACALMGFSLQGASILATLDTSGLPAGDYGLDLQLIDGDGVVNNTATFKNFAFNGLILNTLLLTGTATGTIGSTISMTDADPTPDPFSGALQNFTVTAGASSIAFVLTFSENFAGGFPDAIFAGILNSSFATLASLMLDLADPTVINPVSDNGVTISATDASVPEPGFTWLVGLGAAAMGLRGRRA
jgi:hypothetical protein